MADIVHSSIGASNVNLSVTGVYTAAGLIGLFDERGIDFDAETGYLTRWANYGDTEELDYAYPNVTTPGTYAFPPKVTDNGILLAPYPTWNSYGTYYLKKCSIDMDFLLPGETEGTVMVLYRYETVYTEVNFPDAPTYYTGARGLVLSIGIDHADRGAAGFAPQPLSYNQYRKWGIQIPGVTSFDEADEQPDGTGWMTVAITTKFAAGGVTIKLYKNGVFLGYDAPYLGTNPKISKVCLGSTFVNNPSQYNNALGTYRACYVWKRTLETSEILAMHNAIFAKYGLS